MGQAIRVQEELSRGEAIAVSLKAATGRQIHRETRWTRLFRDCWGGLPHGSGEALTGGRGMGVGTALNAADQADTRSGRAPGRSNSKQRDRKPLSKRMRDLEAALPQDGTVTLSKATIVEWLDDDTLSDEFDPDLTVKEVADLFGLSTKTVTAYIRKGELRAYKRGKEYRIPRANLTNYQLARQSRDSHRSNKISNSVN